MAMVIRVGVAGLGTVGREAVRLLLGPGRDFLRPLGLGLTVAAVCDRDAAREARALRLPPGTRCTKDARTLALDPSLDIVVETMGGLKEARAFVLGSLRAGKHVVTANKRLLSHCWDEIFAAAAASGRRVYFEASVAGGVPLLHAFHRSLAGNRIRRVLGILNGTTNFILSRMAHQGSSLEEALSSAQGLGLAERDPRLDLDGTDAAHKVSILASVLTGTWVRPRQVARAGILGIRTEDIRFAAGIGRAARLIGSISIDWDARPARLTAFVAPALVPLRHPLAAVHGEYNAVLIEASAAGDLMFYGKGAGAGPAGSAVAGDVLLLAQELAVGATGVGQPRRSTPVSVRPASGTEAAFYLRLSVRDRPGALSRIAAALAHHRLSIAQMHQDRGSQGTAPVFLVTHPALQKDFEAARRRVLALPDVGRSHACLRLLD